MQFADTSISEAVQSAAGPATVPRKREPKKGRAAVTNGTRLLNGLKRSARRYRDLVSEYADMLGGWDALNEAQRTLVKKAADLSIDSEAFSTAIANGEPVDRDARVRNANALDRAFEMLGIGSPPVRVTVPLRDRLKRSG
jgi:hypothetical protein